MKPSVTTRSLRIAIATAVGALFAMAADCQTVGTAQDRCTVAPEEYNSPLNGEPGEGCNYASDCNSGHCIPVGGEDAVCSTFGAPNDAYCEASMGPGFVAMTLASCGGSPDLFPTCVPENPDAEPCGQQDCCDYAQPCTGNEQCCSGYCYDEDGDGAGACTAEILDGCPGDAGTIAGADPVWLCVPPS